MKLWQSMQGHRGIRQCGMGGRTGNTIWGEYWADVYGVGLLSMQWCSGGATWGHGSVGHLRQNIGGVMVCYIIWSGCPCNGTGGPVDF
jgi:hypothetical protein